MVGNGPASRRVSTKWTLVQHSAGANGDPSFVRAVENISVSTKKEIDTIKRIGGVLFDTYTESSDAEYKENYPDEKNMGITPRCRGHFASTKIDGLRIYIPSKEKT